MDIFRDRILGANHAPIVAGQRETRIIDPALYPTSEFSPEIDIPIHVGLAAIVGNLYVGGNCAILQQEIAARLTDPVHAPGAWLDLAIFHQTLGDVENAKLCQNIALSSSRLFRQISKVEKSFKLLVIKTPGDFMANTPIEFMVENSGIEVITAYIFDSDECLMHLPHHHAAILAISESPENRHVLSKCQAWLQGGQTSIYNNNPAKISQLDRTHLWKLLSGVESLVCPRTILVTIETPAQELFELSMSAASAARLAFPLILRPEGAHAGESTVLVTNDFELRREAALTSSSRLNISEFTNYVSADGQFRKYRIAVIAGHAYPAHMAISSHWMVHYLNAGMDQSAIKRAEENAWLESFHQSFSPKHQIALNALARLIDLDYFVMDCAETADGKLLIFEIDIAMIVHSMDGAPEFAYKREPMRKLFTAFCRMLTGI
jgi:hypothetical protein